MRACACVCACAHDVFYELRSTDVFSALTNNKRFLFIALQAFVDSTVDSVSCYAIVNRRGREEDDKNNRMLS